MGFTLFWTVGSVQMMYDDDCEWHKSGGSSIDFDLFFAACET